MKANPGGNIDPDDAYGRDLLIDRIWRQLETQCVLLNAERRIGKTTLIKKMVAQPRPGWVPIFQDLEKFTRRKTLPAKSTKRFKSTSQSLAGS